jgi:hypothetical protein
VLSLGIGLGLTMVRSSGETFDPATLALTSWWRASYTASPWVGAASAGISGTRDLTEATNPPTAGAAVNGRTPAAFDGTNDSLTAGGDLDTAVNAASGSGWALVKIASLRTNNPNSYENEAIIATVTNSYYQVVLKTTPEVIFSVFDGVSHKTASAPIATGTWTLVQWRHNGATVQIRVDSGAWVSTASGSVGAVTNAVKIGVDPAGTRFYYGDIADIALTDAVLTDDEFNDVVSYINNRYGLSL